ncbi:MAG: MATE family efflux transporter [Phascolarctobacterium sp.]
MRKNRLSQANKHYLSVAIPAALEGIFMTVLQAADLVMVGALGSAAIAAVSIFMPLRLVLLTFARSLASSVTILTATKFGAGDEEGIKALLRQSLTITILVMGIIHLGFFYFFQELVELMGAKADYLEMAVDYGLIAILAVFISCLSLSVQAIQLGIGSTSMIMKSNVAGNVVNICCNYVLITGIGSFAGWGVRGAAIGTVIGSLVTLGITLWIMGQKQYFAQGFFQLPDKGFWREFKPIFSGIFSELGAERIGMVIYARITADLGTLAFAVHSICYNISDFGFDFLFGFGKANMVLAGQACGRQNFEEWRKYRGLGLAWGMVIATLFGLVIHVGWENIFTLYNKDAAALDLSYSVMLIVAWHFYLTATTIVTGGILRGSGKTTTVAAYSFFLITILRPLMTAGAVYYLEWGILGVWLAICADQILRSCCFTYILYGIKELPRVTSAN